MAVRSKKRRKAMSDKETEPAGHLPEQRAQVEDAAHHLPGQRRQAAGRGQLVRQLLRAAAPRRPVPAGLQARHLHHHAGPARPALRAGPKTRTIERIQIRRSQAPVQARPRHPSRPRPARRRRAAADARLEEAVGLAQALDLEVRETPGRAPARARRPPPCSARARSRRSAALAERARSTSWWSTTR